MANAARSKARIGVLGASGYTGAELLRLLIPHPDVEIALLTADRRAGQEMRQVFPQLSPYALPPLLALDGALCLLEVEEVMPRRVLNILVENFEIDEDVVLRTGERMDYDDWHQLTRLHLPHLKDAPFSPRTIWSGYTEIFDDLRKQIPDYQKRQLARPGLTGWAQVNQSYDQTIDDVKRKVQYDIEYIRRRGLNEDLKIMLRTVPVILFRRGGW